jgi:DtxR family transcriptional regulator, iron-dependent repressor
MVRNDSLVDTTEMYLRTVLELEEEGVPALRARIAERLHQSGPTVSQTVGRMERDGLLTVEGDRHLALTELGRARAVAVMRKHRLAELLGHPTRSPYGNPIPGLGELAPRDSNGGAERTERHLTDTGLSGPAVVSRICESLQSDQELLRSLHTAGIDPGARVSITQEAQTVLVARKGASVRLPREVAARVFVALD